MKNHMMCLSVFYKTCVICQQSSEIYNAHGVYRDVRLSVNAAYRIAETSVSCFFESNANTANYLIVI